MRNLPKNWTTLNVSETFGLRGSYPRDLRIKKTKKTNNLYAHFLPDVEDDPRPNAGRSVSGKRITISESMKTDDPFESAKRAVKWVQQKQIDLRFELDTKEGKFENTLEKYWDIYFENEIPLRETKRNFARWKREELLKWNAKNYGLKNQPFAEISVQLITRSHLRDYFDLLERIAREKNNSNGSGMKGQQKTLINKLFSVAEDDYLGHSFPSFPTIKKEKKQVRHLSREEWDTLLRGVFELGEGKESVCFSPEKYASLDFKPNNRENVRNWVDMWDALNLEWFFFLRAEDMYRLKSEWFSETSDGWFCDLEVTKADRPKHRTTHYRRDAVKFMKRLSKRKPKGYLIFPHMNRPEGNLAESNVLKNLNFLLKIAMDKYLPDFPKSESKWTTIRHTAFRLTLEDNPQLGVQPHINSFAENGRTSSAQLRDTYLRFIELEKTALDSREVIDEMRQIRWGGKYKSRKDVEDADSGKFE